MGRAFWHVKAACGFHSTGNMWVCLEKGRRCAVILSNDVRAEAAFPAIVRALLGESGLPWRWEYGPQPWAK